MDKHKEKTSWITSIKQFFFTYKEAVRVAWKVRKDLLLASTISNAILGTFLLPQLYLSKLLIDNVMSALTKQDVNNSIKNVVIILCIEFVLNTIRHAIDRFDWVFTQILTRYVQIDLELESIFKLNSLPISDSENPHIRDLFRKISDRVGPSTWWLIMSLSFLPYSIFSIASSVVGILTFNPWLLIPAILLSIPEIWVGAQNTKEEYKLETKASSLWREGRAYEDFSSKGRYLYENKILGHTNELLGEVWKVAKDVFEERYKVWTKFAKRRFLVSTPSGISVTALKAYLYIQAILGQITLGTAQFQIGAFNNLIDSMGGLGRRFNDIHENYLYVKDYHEFLAIKDEDYDTGEGITLPMTLGIEFKEVWFKYPQNKNWTLKGVSFLINPKDNIAIVGKNGAGKTTIIKLLCRYYEPQKGEILVNGKNIKDYQLSEYRHIISALFQDFAQYPFSVKKNVIYGDTKKPYQFEEVKKAVHLVGIEDFVNSLPKKYDNPLDNEFEGGIEPSKGQWQRIALARALYRDAEIFILDEPTSNVDPEAEEEIFDKIITLATDKIVFLVSHRFSTVKKADKILVLEKGRIEEYGSHAELMKKEGLYYKLFNLQAKSYSEK